MLRLQEHRAGVDKSGWSAARGGLGRPVGAGMYFDGATFIGGRASFEHVTFRGGKVDL